MENFKKKLASENPEIFKKFLEIERYFIDQSNEGSLEWIDHHAQTFRKYFEENPQEVMKLFAEDPKELYVRLQAKMDAEDEGD